MRKQISWLFVVGMALLLGLLVATAALAQPNVPPARVAGRSLLVAATPTAPASADGVILHVVKRGDTLSEIARRYGVSLWLIANANGIPSPDRIYVGQVLRIPLRAPAPTPTPPLVSTPFPCPCEEIIISSPAGGTLIASPVIVTGVATIEFEGTVLVRVWNSSGVQVGSAVGNVTGGEWGERGPFTVSVWFDPPSSIEPGLIQVFMDSPMNGQLLHLSAVGVQLQP